MKVYKGKDQWKSKSKSDGKATTVDLCRADRKQVGQSESYGGRRGLNDMRSEMH